VKELPPQDLFAEKSLIGSILIDPAIFDSVSAEIRADEFYLADHAEIFRAMLAIRSRGEMVDTVVVASEAAKNIVGNGRVVEICIEALESVPHSAHWKHYCRLIRDAATRRKMISVGVDLQHAAYDRAREADESLGQAGAAIVGIMEGAVSQEAAKSVDLAIDFLKRMENADAGQSLATGFVDIDKLFRGGFRPGQLIVLAARPGVGKSAFAGCIAANAAARGTGVLFVSLEMSAGEVFGRIASRQARMASQEMLSGKMEEWNQDAACRAVNEVGNWPLLVDDRAGRTISQIATLARLHRSRDRIGLVVVDYLQLVDVDDKRKPREQQVAEVTRELKRMARSLGVPVLALAQLNRAIEKRESRRPNLSDLRESGAIEQDADIIIFVDRPSLWDKDEEDKTKAVAIVAKQRNGEIGDIRLTWDGKLTAFGDHVPHYDFSG
jgi:replicative DNA helicase